MNEFGHMAVIVGGFCVDAWGAGPFKITLKGRLYLFEDSDRFGPLLLRKDGSVAERQPGERSPFWIPYHAWRREGRRCAEDGETCLWDDPRPTIIRKLGGRQYLVVSDGDEDGGIVVEESGPTHPVE